MGQFDKFTERARKVLMLAQEEAQRFNHNYIGTEHMLLGLVREGDGVAARVLDSMGVQLPKVRSAVEFIIGRGNGTVEGDIGLTPRAKKVLELAVDEGRRLKHEYVGTEHLLLGLVREGEGIAAGVLESLGVNLQKVRAQVERALAGEPLGSPPPPPYIARSSGPAVESLSRRTLALLVRAFDEAEKTGHPRVGIGHLLLSLLKETDQVVVRALTELEPRLEEVGKAIVENSPPPEGEYEPAQVLSQRAGQVLHRAKYEARIRGNATVEPAHVLLGIAYNAELVAEELLSSLGIELDDLRLRTEEALAEPPPSPPVTESDS